MGNLMGSVKLEGWLARMFYVSLYRMHQMALYGFFRTALMMLGSKIGRGTEPRLNCTDRPALAWRNGVVREYDSESAIASQATRSPNRRRYTSRHRKVLFCASSSGTARIFEGALTVPSCSDKFG
ncbi:hypothetical protein VM57_15535 [Stenotrophomonas maltophilia]|uniref:Uncharacterized protein n=1 Tax=Stenotrophomonas maltophilia TaxID=40324 RepID=A0A0F5ZPM9_STEMA|nr:hypothetical protein VM57_15535 [Stenotrophomonas maltophilia]